MKKLIIKIAVFISLFFLLDYGLDHVLGRLNQRTDSFYTKFIKNEPEVVFLGDSKMRSNVNPKIIKERSGLGAYNLAKYGSGMIYSKGIQEVVLSHYRPEIFVIQAMPLATDRWAVNSLSPFFNNKKVRELLKYYPYFVQLRYSVFRSSKYNWMLLTMVRRLVKDYDLHQGYESRYGVSTESRTLDLNEERDAQVSFGSVFKDFKIPLDAGVGDDLLISFIEEAGKNNIKVLVVAMPTLQEELDYSYYAFKKVAKEMNITFLDYSRKLNEAGILTNEHFNDPQHLNDNGAAVFSRLLGKDIREYKK